MTDRELDILVAEKVMGWPILVPSGKEWFDRYEARGGTFPVAIVHPARIEVAYDNDWPLSGSQFDPSTDIASAMRVVEKMREQGWWLKLTSPWEDGLWWAGFTALGFTGWNGRPDHQAGNELAPRAICLAALKAKGVELE